MTALKRRVVDLDDGRYWALYGQRGVISWCLYSGGTSLDCHGPVTVHSPRPIPMTSLPMVLADDDCAFLEGDCFIDVSDSGGVHIGTEWETAGFDDEAIWRWLTIWYEERFLGIYTADEAAS